MIFCDKSQKVILKIEGWVLEFWNVMKTKGYKRVFGDIR